MFIFKYLHELTVIDTNVVLFELVRVEVQEDSSGSSLVYTEQRFKSESVKVFGAPGLFQGFSRCYFIPSRFAIIFRWHR
jgi:hypothetical protein